MGLRHNTVEAEEATSAPGSQRPTPWRGSLALGWISGAGTTCLLLTSAVKTAAHAGADVGGGGTRRSPLGSRAPGLQPLGDWLPGHPVSVRTLHGAGEHSWPLCRQGLICPDPSLTSPGLGQVRVRPSTASAIQPGQRCQVGSKTQTPRCHRVGGCEETGEQLWEGKRTGHRPHPQPASCGHHSGVPFLP